MGANINDLDYTVSKMFNSDGTRRESINKIKIPNKNSNFRFL